MTPKIYQGTADKIFNNVAGYKINSQKSVALLYTNGKWAEKEIREIIPSTIATNNIKISCGNSNQTSERPV